MEVSYYQVMDTHGLILILKTTLRYLISILYKATLSKFKSTKLN
jgi:hypothetical protein